MSKRLHYTIKGVNKSISKEDMEAILQAYSDLYYSRPITVDMQRQQLKETIKWAKHLEKNIEKGLEL